MCQDNSQLSVRRTAVKTINGILEDMVQTQTTRSFILAKQDDVDKAPIRSEMGKREDFHFHSLKYLVDGASHDKAAAFFLKTRTVIVGIQRILHMNALMKKNEFGQILKLSKLIVDRDE